MAIVNGRRTDDHGGGRPIRTRTDVPAPRLARGILIAVLLFFVLVRAINVIGAPLTWLAELTCLSGLAAILLLQFVHSTPHAARASAKRKALTLGAQASITFVLLAVFPSQWGAMTGFLAGSLLLVLRSRLAWTLYVLLGMVMFFVPLITQTMGSAAYLSESTLLTGLVVFGLSWLAELVSTLHDTRSELARLAVTNERLRFARDLHDLLGYSLSAITLKSELVHRIVYSHPHRAREEVAAILDVSRQALSDIRGVATGYRAISLSQEAASARSVLQAADVETEVEIGVSGLTEEADTVLGIVLREAITNALRHSHVRRCRIDADERDGFVRVTVANDGVERGREDADPHSGSGLGNLRARLRALGGRLTVDHDEDWFRLVAEVPAEKALRSDAERGAVA